MNNCDYSLDSEFIVKENLVYTQKTPGIAPRCLLWFHSEFQKLISACASAIAGISLYYKAEISDVVYDGRPYSAVDLIGYTTFSAETGALPESIKFQDTNGIGYYGIDAPINAGRCKVKAVLCIDRVNYQHTTTVL